MTQRIEFEASVGKIVKIITGLTVFLLIVVAVIGFAVVKAPDLARAAMVVLPLAILLGAAMFSVRGYVIEADVLHVRRLGWSTRIPLPGLQTAVADPEAMKGSVRIVGNGGLFCFAGLFWSQALGKHRAYVTDPANAVVLRWRDRTVVVSPTLPDKFVDEITKR